MFWLHEMLLYIYTTGPLITHCVLYSSSHMHVPLAIECGDPGVPQNGSRQLSGRTAGSSVMYRCDTGFELVGAQTLRCMDSGEWSDRLPECRGT